jgi:curved DNA-binding protein
MDYYQIMGVAKTATPEEIKLAHRKLARKYHPDVSKEPDAEAQFKKIGEAWEVLKDPEKRAAYDQYGAHWKEGGQAHASRRSDGAASGYRTRGAQSSTDHTHHTEHPYGTYGASGDDPSDLFEQFFRQNAAQQAGAERQSGQPFAYPGQDRHARIEISLEDAYAGATRRLILSFPTLNASGGVESTERTIEFKVPIGIRAGQHIRLAGQGWPGSGGAPSGDLFLDVAFLPHRLYRVDKTDVFLDLPVSPWEAALGAELQAPTPSGLVSLSIPAGSTQGKKLRLKGKGLPAKTPGDFYFVLNIVNPQAQSDEDRAAYRHMAEQFKTFNPRAHLGATL